MSETANLILEAAKKLAPQDRVDLINELDVWSESQGDFDYEVSPEYAAELERRTAELEADPTRVVQWMELKARLLATLPND